MTPSIMISFCWTQPGLTLMMHYTTAHLQTTLIPGKTLLDLTSLPPLLISTHGTPLLPSPSIQPTPHPLPNLSISTKISAWIQHHTGSSPGQSIPKNLASALTFNASSALTEISARASRTAVSNAFGNHLSPPILPLALHCALMSTLRATRKNLESEFPSKHFREYGSLNSMRA